jgi:hypothetical protein
MRPYKRSARCELSRAPPWALEGLRVECEPGSQEHARTRKVPDQPWTAQDSRVLVYPPQPRSLADRIGSSAVTLSNQADLHSTFIDPI